MAPKKKRARVIRHDDPRPVPAKVLAYESWMRSRGVTWNDAVSTTDIGVVAGYGCVASRTIKKGVEIFRVPRNACLGATSQVADTGDEVTTDSQLHLANLVLDERAKGEASEWAPMLNMLEYNAPCPWLWPEAQRQAYLKGTELEPVVRLKLERLEQEWRSLEKGGKGGNKGKRGGKKNAGTECSHSRESYLEACAMVLSHVNPWFGGAIYPSTWH